MSSDPNSKPAQHNEQQEPEIEAVDPRDLVYKEGGYLKDPRAVVDNPAVTPMMINEPSDLRDDLYKETEEG